MTANPKVAIAIRAAELLEAYAKSFRQMFYGNKDARNYCSDMLTTALELRLLARSMQVGDAAVPPAPTFERK